LPHDEVERLHEVTNMMWLCRLGEPERTDLLDIGRALLQNPDLSVNSKEPAVSADLVFQVRLARLANRWQRLGWILQRIAHQERAAVTGRFYRLLSQQVYNLEQRQAQWRPAPKTPAAWQALTKLDGEARLLQREALEFLGGVLVSQRQLDGERAGPGICDLADRLLQEYAMRTGVNWGARTILGRDPFLELKTEVIRVRFPDWSLWNLPLISHEFGHLVAQVTPRWRLYQRKEMQTVAQPDLADIVEAHLEEFFADIFAAYTLGPAFVCAAVLLQFDPSTAYLARVAHPTHHERVQVALQTLAYMNDRVRTQSKDANSYTSVYQRLKDTWQSAVDACGSNATPPVGAADQCQRALRWGDELYQIVDASYRLGAGYTAERWVWAQTMAKDLLQRNYSWQQMQQHARDHKLAGITCIDLLNVLWRARLDNPLATSNLPLVALQLGREYLKE
jgi:hypothetical protein